VGVVEVEGERYTLGNEENGEQKLPSASSKAQPDSTGSSHSHYFIIKHKKLVQL
jgi:hypothetical protein